MQIFVKLFSSNKTYTIEVEPTHTIDQVIENIIDKCELTYSKRCWV
jgi:hypothetical protein